jgi:indolepyruvate ferredoxin oxidoreductase
MPADFTRKPDLEFPLGSMEQEIRDAVGPEAVEFIDATRLALGLMGDSIATNLFMVGYAYQKGLLPVSEASILRSLELNGAAVESNKKSFHWGRLAAVDRAAVTAAATPQQAAPASQLLSESLDEIVARRVAFLTKPDARRHASNRQYPAVTRAGFVHAQSRASQAAAGERRVSSIDRAVARAA